ncbi:MAG: hypothetical protein EBZ49_04320 [Proteobacteria bacterium]|nr:hypothetical protein [Pseudomonadota bacterium]
MWIKALIFVLIGASTVLSAELLTQNHCPAPLVVNHTRRWTPHDQKALKRAQGRCRIIYSDAPCLKRFDKLEDLRYTALCGK